MFNARRLRVQGAVRSVCASSREGKAGFAEQPVPYEALRRVPRRWVRRRVLVSPVIVSHPIYNQNNCRGSLADGPTSPERLNPHQLRAERPRGKENMSSPSFAQLGVPNFIVSALAQRNIHEPFQIQAATIADALAGRDVCGRAPTGSGKTLAFGIPLVATVDRAEPKRPRALILAPTRELAEQINSELKTFAGAIKIGVVYGGVGYQPQVNSLRRGVDILVACPGRLEDLIEQNLVSLADVDKVVLDEADRMADMGFMPSVRRLLDQTSRNRQTVLFSATLDGDIAKLTRDYQKDPVLHEVGESTPDITAAKHLFWNVVRADRVEVAASAIQASWPSIVFCRTRHGSDRVVKQLARAGVDAVAIHGGRSQSQRTRALDDFTRGKVMALVATDVASRGIHVDGVASVVHFDPPEDHKAYTHRSGRTARAGESGVVVSLVQPEQKKELRKMQRQVGLDEPFTDPDPAAASEASPTIPRKTTSPKTKSSQATSSKSHSNRDSQASGDSRRSSNRNGKPRNGNQARSHSGSGRGSSRDDHSRNDQSRRGNSRRSDSRRDDTHSSAPRSDPGTSESRDGESHDRQRSGAPRRSGSGKAEGSRYEERGEGRNRSTDSRQGAPKQSGRQGAPKRSGKPGPKNSAKPGQKKNRHPAGETNGKPNRKARRAHLQQGAAGKRS